MVISSYDGQLYLLPQSWLHKPLDRGPWLAVTVLGQLAAATGQAAQQGAPNEEECAQPCISSTLLSCAVIIISLGPAKEHGRTSYLQVRFGFHFDAALHCGLRAHLTHSTKNEKCGPARTRSCGHRPSPTDHHAVGPVTLLFCDASMIHRCIHMLLKLAVSSSI